MGVFNDFLSLFSPTYIVYSTGWALKLLTNGLNTKKKTRRGRPYNVCKDPPRRPDVRYKSTVQISQSPKSLYISAQQLFLAKIFLQKCVNRDILYYLRKKCVIFNFLYYMLKRALNAISYIISFNSFKIFMTQTIQFFFYFYN